MICINLRFAKPQSLLCRRRGAARLLTLLSLAGAFVFVGLVVGMIGYTSRRVTQEQTAAGLARTLRGHPGNADLYVAYARALTAEGHPDRAAGALSGALLLRPDHVGARLKLAEALIAQGRLTASERHLEALLRRDASSVDARLLLAQIYTARRQFPAAAKILSEQASDRSNPRLLVALGEANSRMDEWEQAETAFRSALTLNPQLARANSGLGQVLAQKGEADTAAKLFAKACALAPNDPAAWHALGYHQLQSGTPAGFQQAVQAFHRELNLTSPTPQTLYLLGMAEHRLGKSQEAAATLETAADLDPGERSIAFEQARVYDALADKPRAAAARARFTRLLALQTQEEKLRRQMSAAPPSPAAYGRIAALLLEQGRSAQALWELEQGMRLFPNDAGLRKQAAPLFSAFGLNGDDQSDSPPVAVGQTP